MADSRVSSQLSGEKIGQLLDPKKYVGFSKEFVDCLTGKK
jgi:adenylosuccinate lyase